MSNELFNDNQEALDELMEILKRMPKQHITMLNMPRYAQAVQSIKKIVAYVKNDCPEAEVEVFFDELTGTSLCLKIIADEFNVYKIKDFCKAIEPANTMCVVPRLDCTVEIGFTYEGAQIPVSPAN